MAVSFGWSRRAPKGHGYEVSTKGDARFSAMTARMPDRRTIEEWYQCDLKGYAPGGRDWRLGKGKPPKMPISPEDLYQSYKTLWRIWAVNNVALMQELYNACLPLGNGFPVLTDCFASTDINQARALSEILNEWTSEG